MKKVYITFGGQTYDPTISRIVSEAPKFGADEVWVYDDQWLNKTEFRQLNRWLWDHPRTRGVGWFAWKPFVIMDALGRLADGDIVLFTDGDTYPVADLSVLFNICQRDGVMLFAASGHANRRWCKRDCYLVMGQDEARYYDMQHGVARFILFQKGPWKPQQFLIEWLTYCVNPNATTFDPSRIGVPELDGFLEHRCEQAILTLLAGKYGYKLHREACQFGEGFPEDRDIYPQLFFQEGRPGSSPDTAGSSFRNVPDRT